MPLVFTREEIREYLDEMGYGNLNEDDLNQFVKDLRKLIKMESRKRRRRRLGHTGHTQSDLSSTMDETNSMQDSSNVESPPTPIPKIRLPSSESSSDNTPRLLYLPKSRQKPNQKLFSETSDSHNTDSVSNSTPYSFTTTTDSSSQNYDTSASNFISTQNSAKTTPGSTLQSRVQFAEVVSKSNRIHTHRPPSSTNSADAIDGSPLIRKKFASNDQQDHSKMRKDGHVLDNIISENESASGSVVDLNCNKSTSSTDSLSDTDLLNLMEYILRGDITLTPNESGSEIKKKLEIPLKIRRDPVALYHWYKTFWDKQKAPGEDRHMQLRWNVRAGTVGKYPCDADGVRINYLRLNPLKPKKISAF